jgi:hypothetical protein
MLRGFIPLLSLALLSSELVFSDTSSLGLIGGQNGTAAYAAFVDGNGNLTPLNLGIPNGKIGFSFSTGGAVAINNNGLGLIGGQNGNAPYAAFVGPENNVSPLDLGVSLGDIRATAINANNLGIIAGGYGTNYSFYSCNPYAAFVSTDGTVTQIPISGVGFGITDVAINDSGLAIIGGANGNAYAALAQLNNPLSPQVLNLGLSGSSGGIDSVAINDSGIGLVVGGDGTNPYAAFVGPGGTLTQLTGFGSNELNPSGINNSGYGLIGGDTNNSGSGSMVAYRVQYGSTNATAVTGLPSTINSALYSLEVNDSGMGIVGGSVAGTAFAALVPPTGAAQVLTLNVTSGSSSITNVAINELGIGLVGGTNGSAAYAALVAPGGQVTPLNLQIPSGNITSTIIDLLVTPDSIGSNWASFNSQLAASYALNTHMTEKHRMAASSENKDLSLLVSASDNIPMQMQSSTDPVSDQNMIWFSPYGNYVHQKAEGSNPSAGNTMGGFLLGYDYSYSDLTLGGALGYSYNYVSLGSGSGHGSVQEENVTFYGSYEQKNLMVNFALWGGLYQWYNTRNTLSFIQSKAFTQGWIFTPHLEIATPFMVGSSGGFSLEPFVMVDYVNNWMGGYTEKGASGFNLKTDRHYSSLLRSEAGFRMFEEWDINMGKFVFTQKLSYVNQAPFHFNTVTTSFVASGVTFPIAIGSSNVQNLGGVELRATFLPQNSKYPYFTLGAQGEFGSSYQSYFGNIEIGKAF